MRPAPNPRIESHRTHVGPFAEPNRVHAGTNTGYFEFRRNGALLFVISSGTGEDCEGWEHVSVHVRQGVHKRCPTWDEMCFVKSLFWLPEECVVQYHPPAKDNISIHDYTLHLWRPLNADIPMPPKDFV